MPDDAQVVPATVLIVEDDDLVAELIADVVEVVGATPLVAYDGQQALDLARAALPALVIADMLVPKMSGDTLIAALRAELGAQLPIILVSGLPIDHLAQAGADAVLLKPFRIADLMALLGRFIAV